MFLFSLTQGNLYSFPWRNYTLWTAEKKKRKRKEKAFWCWWLAHKVHGFFRTEIIKYYFIGSARRIENDDLMSYLSWSSFQINFLFKHKMCFLSILPVSSNFLLRISPISFWSSPAYWFLISFLKASLAAGNLIL